MAGSWELPPVTPHGVSYKAADFVLWMLRAPVVSERARAALESPLEGLVEFLPFHSVRRAPYYAVNVLARDDRAAIFKDDPKGVVLVDERVGEVIREHSLTGAALADPSNAIGGRIVRGESLHDYPGLLG